MKLNLRFTLLCAILVLMVCSLAAVSLVALTRHRAMAKLVGERAIEQATNDVAFRVTRFLENGPAALSRIKHVIERRGIALMDAERMTDYLVAEAQASPALTWVSVSDAATGSFLGITRRDGKLVLNRSVPTLNNGIAREWELRADSTWMPLTSGPGVPYDPRLKPWFALGMGTDGPRWTDPYEFAEGLAGISVVIGLTDPGTHRPAGVATADFHLREIEMFLSELRVGREGRVVVIAPLSTGGHLVFGVLSALPANIQSVLPVVTERALSRTFQPEHRDGKPDVLFRDTIGGVIVDGRALAIPGGLVWHLVVLLPSADVEAPIEAATTAVFIVACIFLLIGIAAAAWMAHAISRPIRLMSQDLVDIGALRFSRPAPPRSFIGEIDAMSRSLVCMKAALRSFMRYVPVDVVRSVLLSGRPAELGGEVRVLTVLISDVVGFTAIAEAMPPGALVRRLSAYFEVLEQAVNDETGLVDKFMGDGMLAFFNAQGGDADHAARACTAALSVQHSLEKFNANGDSPSFHTRIGLATGEVVIGNIGTSQRLSYTAIGDAVNLACRLEMLNKAYGTKILASEDVHRAAQDDFEWRHLDRVTVPGRSRPLELYELLGHKGEVDAETLAVRDLHEVALRAFVAGSFDEAERGFVGVLAKAPHDQPARILLDFTTAMRLELVAKRQAEAWRGVHPYSSKM